LVQQALEHGIYCTLVFQPAPASETVDTVEGTSSSSDSEEEQQEKSPIKQGKTVLMIQSLVIHFPTGVKHAEKRKHLKSTSGSSSSDEELRDLYKKSKVYCQPRQYYSLPPKRVKILPASKAASISRPYIDFYKMERSRRISMVRYRFTFHLMLSCLLGKTTDSQN